MEIQNNTVCLTKVRIALDKVKDTALIVGLWLQFKDGTPCEILPSTAKAINPHLLGAPVLKYLERANNGENIELNLRTYRVGTRCWTYESELVQAVNTHRGVPSVTA